MDETNRYGETGGIPKPAQSDWETHSAPADKTWADAGTACGNGRCLQPDDLHGRKWSKIYAVGQRRKNQHGPGVSTDYLLTGRMVELDMSALMERVKYLKPEMSEALYEIMNAYVKMCEEMIDLEQA